MAGRHPHSHIYQDVTADFLHRCHWRSEPLSFAGANECCGFFFALRTHHQEQFSLFLTISYVEYKFCFHSRTATKEKLKFSSFGFRNENDWNINTRKKNTSGCVTLKMLLAADVTFGFVVVAGGLNGSIVSMLYINITYKWLMFMNLSFLSLSSKPWWQAGITEGKHSEDRKKKSNIILTFPNEKFIEKFCITYAC